LGRQNLTYLGMPEEDALDVRALSPAVRNLVCIDTAKSKLDSARHAIANLPIHIDRYHAKDMWLYLKDDYIHEGLIADVTFLDFLGGGIVSNVPFQKEIAGLQAYFACHAKSEFINRAFILAWTFMPHDAGEEHYLRHLSKCLFPADIELLRKQKGINFRALAIRLLLRHILAQHDMSALVYEHLLYKKVMNTLILVFCRGEDHDCAISLLSPDKVITSPITEYQSNRATPVTRNFNFAA